MTPQHHHPQASKLLIPITLGWLFTTIFSITVEGWKIPTLPNIIILTGGFPIALFVVWVLTRERIWSALTNMTNKRSSLTCILVSASYPFIILLWMCLEVVGVTPQEDFSWVTLPALLVFNLAAPLIINSLTQMTEEGNCFSKELRRMFPSGNGRLIPSLIWWLWHLPLIFVNGTALSHLNYPNAWLIIYLIIVLAVSFFLSTGNKKERRDISPTAF